MTDYKFYSLAQKPELRAPLLELIQKTFPTGEAVARPSKLDDEFALLLDPANAARCLVATQGPHPIAHVAYRIFDFGWPGLTQPFRVAGIGLVVTDENYRRQNLAARLLALAEEQARQEAAAMAVLWSGAHDFFSKRNYLLSGQEYQWSIPSAQIKKWSAPVTPPYRIAPLTHFDETRSLYLSQAIGPARNGPYETLRKLPNTFCLGAYTHNTLAAYVSLGKARDLRNVLHEGAGDPGALPQLLNHAVTLLDGPRLDLQFPPTSPWRDTLTHHLGAGQRSAHAYFKVLAPIATVEMLQAGKFLPTDISLRYAPTPEHDGRFPFEILHAKKSLFASDDSGHLLQLFFGPWHSSELTDLSPELQRALAAARIPPLYFWGFDSV